MKPKLSGNQCLTGYGLSGIIRGMVLAQKGLYTGIQFKSDLALWEP